MKVSVFFGTGKFVRIHDTEVDEAFVTRMLSSKNVISQRTEYGMLYHTGLFGQPEETNVPMSRVLGFPAWGKGVLAQGRDDEEFDFGDAVSGYLSIDPDGTVEPLHGKLEKLLRYKLGTGTFSKDLPNGTFHFLKELEIEGRLGNVPLNEEASRLAKTEMYGRVIFEPSLRDYGAATFENAKALSYLRPHEKSLLDKLLTVQNSIHDLVPTGKTDEEMSAFRIERARLVNKKRAYLLTLLDTLSFGHGKELSVRFGECGKYRNKSYVSIFINGFKLSTSHFNIDFFKANVLPEIKRRGIHKK